MLVIIVSLGLGIIEPILGQMLYRIVGVGALYFILLTVDAFAMHDVDNKTLLFTQVHVNDKNPFQIIIIDPIDYFGFNYLGVDFRELDGNNENPTTTKNVMILAIYRHFAYILVFMVVGKFYILTRVRNHDKWKWARLPIEQIIENTHPAL